MKATLPERATGAVLAIILCAGCGVVGQSGEARPAKSGVNKDAMTMQDCRDRLALPKDKRSESDDKRVDLDGICRNMLSAETSKAAVAKPSASRPSGAAFQ